MESSAPVIGTDGRPISERELRRGMRINILAGSAGMMWAAVAGGMPLTMFLEAIKAPGVLIGLSTTVQQFAMLLQVPAAFFGETLRSRKLFWCVIALLHRACWLFPALLPFVMARHPMRMASALVIILLVSSLLAQAATAVWWSWMSDLIPERLRGRFWGTRQSITMGAYLVATLGAGYVLDVFADPQSPGGKFTGFALVFGAAGLLGCLDIIVHLGVPEPKPTPVRFDWRVVARVLAPLRQPDFRMLTFAMSAWAFAIGIVGQFGFLCLKREYGIGYTWMSMGTISSALGVVVASFLWAYVMDRIGARNFGVIMMVLAVSCGLVWFFMRPGDVTLRLPFLPPWTLPQAMAVLLVANFIAGAFYSGVGLSQISLLSALSTPQGRTMAMAVHWAVLGLTAALGPIVGGVLMDWFTAHPLDWRLPTGVQFHFFHALVVLQIAICWFVAVPLFMKVQRRAGEMAFRTAVSRFVIFNPLRVVSSIYNIYSMGVSESRQERVDAVRKLGEDKTAIAISDLIAEMDDPSIEVREEAVRALGRIGSPDAIEALLKRLADPAGDLVPEIARALRRSSSLAAAEALAGKLPEVGDETACEIVRTLGEIKDRSVAPAVQKLLHAAENPKVVAVCAEALAHLGEFSAVYEILPRMKDIRSPVLNCTLTVALGDLLGESGGFYRVLSREERKRGTDADALLERVARAIKVVAARRHVPEADTQRLLAQVKTLDNAYVEGQLGDAVTLLAELGKAIVYLDLGLQPVADTSALIEAVFCRDEQAGAGLWYLQLMRDKLEREGVANVELTDALLGIYFLAGWARRQVPDASAVSQLQTLLRGNG